MKSRSAKNKGASLQKTVALRIGELLDVEVGSDCDIESRGMGQSGTDIRLSPRLRGVFPYSIECKNTERLAIWEAIAQSKENQIEGTSWLVIAKRNRDKPIVIMDMDTFFNLQDRIING